ncbi:hypothetical protein [Pararhodobacter zhoushanensis]|uniref:Uncharacterized protein n=1 Tax=Pararhodobacter zhoushanensis TaxID=2479545 RepID=A0ABT3H4N2_9RHOB|nr:hypothetical protein [Pararhodobacter zhoushanensis]MCW1934763.1 hypothetical protein [Pararhodobacter zhoushanensis]
MNTDFFILTSSCFRRLIGRSGTAVSGEFLCPSKGELVPGRTRTFIAKAILRTVSVLHEQICAEKPWPSSQSFPTVMPKQAAA